MKELIFSHFGVDYVGVFDYLGVINYIWEIDYIWIIDSTLASITIHSITFKIAQNTGVGSILDTVAKDTEDTGVSVSLSLS